MDPTPQQANKLASIRKAFGNACEKSYQINRYNGVMRVRLRAAAGTWHWSFDRAGELVHCHLDMPLFDERADASAEGTRTPNATSEKYRDT